MHRYLVVANQTLGSDELVALVRERTADGPAEFWLVVPATPVKDLASNAIPIPMPVMGGISTLPAPPAEARRLLRQLSSVMADEVEAIRGLEPAPAPGRAHVGDRTSGRAGSRAKRARARGPPREPRGVRSLVSP